MNIHDDFHRSDRDLMGDPIPGTNPVLLWDYQGTKKAVIRNNVFVCDPALPLTGAYRAAILTKVTTPALVVTADYSFSEGATARQNVVIGSCTKTLAKGSVQFAVWPRSADNGKIWQVFTVKVVNGNTVYNYMASGIIPDLTYGTVYRSTMTVDLAASSVECVLPNGQIITVVDPEIATLWGLYPFTQIRRQVSETDGQAAVSMFSAEG